MNTFGFDNNNKKGRPGHEEHRCDTCQKTYKSASSLAQHRSQVKSGRVKCVALHSSDGSIALQQTLNLIATGLGPKSMFNHPLPQVFKQERQEYLQRRLESSTSSDTIELLEKRLGSTVEWEMVYDLCHSEDFNSLPLNINEKFALSFLVQTASMEVHHPSFFSAFVKVISALTIRKIPAHLLEAFKPFLQKFRPTKDDKIADLIILFEFTKALGCCWEWLSFAQEKAVIIMSDPVSCTLQESGPLTEAFASQHELYSSSFFAAYDNMMRLPGLQRIIFNYIEEFFQFVLDGKERRVTYELLINFKSFKQAHKEFDICLIANKLRACTTQIIPDDDILQLIRMCLKHNESIIMEQIRLREVGENMPAFVSRLEDILQEKAARIKAEEDKQLLKAEGETKKKVAEEEQKRIAIEQEQQRLQELEEQKQKTKEEKILYQEQLIASIRHQLDLFDKNQFREETLAQVFSFVDDLQTIAATIKKTLRPEQFVTLGLLILSQKHTTLIQLATGAGKSLMLGVQAQYLNQTTGKKVIVSVPTPFLHLYQESNYCPNASKIPEDINDPTSNDIFYCTYEQLLQLEPAVLSNAIVLIDEFHELFFNYPLAVNANGRLVSVIQQLMVAFKVIGVSATFRGDAGIKKIRSIMNDSLFLSTPEEFKEKKMQVEVFGELTLAAIKERAILLTDEKSKQMPVIVFCNDVQACYEWKEHFSTARIFAGDNAGALVALLDYFKGLSSGIILTTSAACKGADFVFAVSQAFVIHTMLPSNWLQLQQNYGRGVRGNQELPVVGAIFTSDPYNNIEQIKKALSFSDRFDRLFTPDYIQAHSILVACSTSNVNTPAKTFETAVEMLNNGKSAAEIYKVLCVVKRFREFLPKEAPKSQFRIPTAIQLGKRNIPEKSTVNTLDNYMPRAARSTASSTMAKALKDADDILEQMEVQQTTFNLPQVQQEDYEHSAFEDEATTTFNQKDKSDQVMFKHDALQAIAIAKAKEVLVGIDEFSEEAKSEDPEQHKNM